MANDLSDAFGELVARMDTAMIIVTTVADDERSGCLVGFHSQCSIDPPRYAVWISKRNHTFGLLRRADHLAVHVLGPSHQPLAELFGGQTGDKVDKFARCRWSDGPFGVPLLDDVTTRFVAELSSVFDNGGDHLCLVVSPGAVELGSDETHPVLRLSDEHDVDPGHSA